jgi:hypothetical protein
MAVIVNKNTTQQPLATGLTGAAVIKWIDAPRVYIKTADSTPTPVTTKSNGSTPAGWTDLGSILGQARIQYDKEIKEIRTGLDNVLRQSYVGQKTAGVEFVCSQLDDVVIQELSGLTASQIVSASTYQFLIGSEDVIQKALLVVSQNKLDGREWQWYNPNAFISFVLEENGEEKTVRGRANCPAFTVGSAEPYFIMSKFA